MTGEAYASFMRAIHRLTGLDLSCYKPDQLQRRLPTLLGRLGIGSLKEYASLLARDPDRLREFWDWVGIHVSEFFRDPPFFHFLEQRLLPELLAQRSSIRIWSAGCSIGAEPYSLAILLEEIGQGRPYRILATDVSPEVMRQAKNGGPYKSEMLRGVPASYRQRWFTTRPDGHWVRREITMQVRFTQHDLLQDPYPTSLDLITCRNVAIYFTTTARDYVYQQLAESLTVGGVLALGGSEAIPRPQDLGLERLAPSCYRRVAPVAQPKQPLMSLSQSARRTEAF